MFSSKKGETNAYFHLLFGFYILIAVNLYIYTVVNYLFSCHFQTDSSSLKYYLVQTIGQIDFPVTALGILISNYHNCCGSMNEMLACFHIFLTFLHNISLSQNQYLKPVRMVTTQSKYLIKPVRKTDFLTVN